MSGRFTLGQAPLKTQRQPLLVMIEKGKVDVRGKRKYSHDVNNRKKQNKIRGREHLLMYSQGSYISITSTRDNADRDAG